MPGVEWVGGCLQTGFSARPDRREPPRRKKQPARGRKRKPAARGRARGKGRASPEVLQRRLDLAGLCCIGLAVYLGYVIYLGWNGGTVGDGSETALSYAVGAGAVVVPVALGLAGIALILRPFLPSPRSVAVGVVAIACGLLLALAAQTAGLGPDGVRKELFDPDFFPHHGGGIGETLYWATTTLFQRIGAHIIAVLLVVSGLLLISGRSVSDMIRAGRRGGRASETRHRRLRDGREGEPGRHRPRPDRHLTRLDRAGLRPARADRRRRRGLPGACARARRSR